MEDRRGAIVAICRPVEMLARYIGHRLLDDLRKLHQFAPHVLRVEVEENIGQSATFEWRPK